MHQLSLWGPQSSCIQDQGQGFSRYRPTKFRKWCGSLFSGLYRMWLLIFLQSQNFIQCCQIVTLFEFHATRLIFWNILQISSTLNTNWYGHKVAKQTKRRSKHHLFCFGYNAMKMKIQLGVLHFSSDDCNLNPNVTSCYPDEKIRDFPKTIGWTRNKSCQAINFATANPAAFQCRRFWKHDRKHLCQIFHSFPPLKLCAEDYSGYFIQFLYLGQASFSLVEIANGEPHLPSRDLRKEHRLTFLGQLVVTEPVCPPTLGIWLSIRYHKIKVPCLIPLISADRIWNGVQRWHQSVRCKYVGCFTLSLYALEWILYKETLVCVVW